MKSELKDYLRTLQKLPQISHDVDELHSLIDNLCEQASTELSEKDFSLLSKICGGLKKLKRGVKDEHSR